MFPPAGSQGECWWYWGLHKTRLLGFLSESLQMYSQLQPDMDNVYKRLVFPKPLPHPTSQITLWCCRRAWLHQLACITQTSQQNSHTPSGKGKSLLWLRIWLDPGAGFTSYRLRHTSYGEGGFSFVPFLSGMPLNRRLIRISYVLPSSSSLSQKNMLCRHTGPAPGRWKRMGLDLLGVCPNVRGS